MITPIEINVGALIRSREAARQALVSGSDSGTITTENDLKEIVDSILTKLPAGKEKVIVTNQGIGNGAEGYFIMTLDHEKISLNEHKTFQKIAYDYEFNTKKIVMNNQVVDKSFIAQFLNKMDNIMVKIKMDKAKVMAS